jgi:hypothetical protein
MYNTEADLFLEARKLPVRRRIHVRRRMHMYNTEADLFLEARKLPELKGQTRCSQEDI